MGLGWGGGMQLSSCLHRASTGWKGDKAFLESCLSMEVGWSLRDGRGHPVQCSGIADVPVLTVWPATLMNH